MTLPDLIEMVPLDGEVSSRVLVPGSKSITNRALVLAALAGGEVTLSGALWSEDTQVMVDCLQELGYMVTVNPDPLESCNRTITVYGKGPEVPRGGTVEQPLDLFVGNAGTAARFLTALVCLGSGHYRLHGVPRMHERPQAALFQALRELGYRLRAESGEDRLPVVVEGRGPFAGRCQVSIEESSQFASALLLGAGPGKWEIDVVGENAEESPYVAMTSRLIDVFPHAGGTFAVEPDASSGSYFWAAGWLCRPQGEAKEWRDLAIQVDHWPETGWQFDEAFPKFLPLPATVSRLTDLGDSIMTGIVLAPWARAPVTFTDLGRLRVQECERVKALRQELTRCGARIREEGDTLTVYPAEEPLHGAVIETYDDHRMAMCFAVLGLRVPGIKLKHPSCVKKTFPNYFQKLAAPSPHGLGARILDGHTGRPLAGQALFAS